MNSCSAKVSLTDRVTIGRTVKQNQIDTLSIRQKKFGSVLDLAGEQLAQGIKLCQSLADGRAEKIDHSLLARVQLARGDFPDALVSTTPTPRRRANQSRNCHPTFPHLKHGQSARPQYLWQKREVIFRWTLTTFVLSIAQMNTALYNYNDVQL